MSMTPISRVVMIVIVMAVVSSSTTSTIIRRVRGHRKHFKGRSHIGSIRQQRIEPLGALGFAQADSHFSFAAVVGDGFSRDLRIGNLGLKTQ
jgi:hypothetical protein